MRNSYYGLYGMPDPPLEPPERDDQEEINQYAYKYWCATDKEDNDRWII